MTRLDFFFTVNGDIFGYFSSNSIVSIFLYSSSVFLFLSTITGNEYVIRFDLFLLLLLGNILHGLNGSFIHPTFRSYIIENLWDKLIECFVNSLFVLGVSSLIDLGHEPIKEPHYLLIVISIFLKSEDDITLLQEVILKSLPIIYGLDLLINSLIDIVGFSQRIFLLHVRYNTLLNMEVNKFHLSFTQRVFSCEEQNILENALWAKDFGMLVCHVVLG